VSSVSRRTLLRTALASAAGAMVGGSMLRARAVAAQSGEARAVELARGFHVLSVGDTNVLAVTAGDGLALVDGGSAAQSPALLRAAAALPGGAKIHTLFNTHWHPEQTGSNEALAKQGAAIIAQRNTQLWLSTDVTWPWNDETVEPLPRAARPSKTFFTEETYTLGDRKARCGHLRDCPHTDGDLYVYFPDDNVLAVGGAAGGVGWPEIDWWTGGWIGGLVGGLDMLKGIANDDTKIVPANGPVLTRADLQKEFEMYSAIWERLAKTLYSGGGPTEAVAANPTKEFDDIMGHSDAFVRRAFQSLWAYLSPDA
jgi:glyoxylase-like metal-dependent hydrolase (beta-lactamase superfamily II)